MKKVILMLLAIITLIFSCQKQNSFITEVRGTQWKIDYYSQGVLSFKYRLLLDRTGGGECKIYNISYPNNIPKETLEDTYKIKYQQLESLVTIHFLCTTEKGEEESIALYNLQNNRLQFIKYIQQEYPWVDVYDFILVP